MTDQNQRIILLAAQARAALKELNEAIIAAAPDADKEVIADRFNVISAEITSLDAWAKAKGA